VSNFLGLVYETRINETGQLTTAFSRMYGDMDTSAVGNFNAFFPIMTLVIMGLQCGNGINIILKRVGLAKYQFGDEVIDEKDVEKSIQRLAREKKSLQRTAERAVQARARGAGATRRRRSVLEAAFGGGEQQGIELRTARPEKKSGWLEKQSPKVAGMAGHWSQRYCEVDEPGLLRYFKDANAQELAGAIDLRLTISIELHAKKSGGGMNSRRIDIKTADRVFKLRCQTIEESQEWLENLLAWRDHAIDRNACEPIVEFDEDAPLTATTTGTKGAVSSPLHNNNGGGSRTASDKDRDSNASSLERPSRRTSMLPPPPLEGMLQKKSREKSKWIDSWQSRYFRVHAEDATLKYFKSETDKSAKGSIDLRAVLEISKHVSSKHNEVRDNTRIDLDCGAHVLRLKANSELDADRWIAGLNEWREYFFLTTDLSTLKVIANTKTPNFRV
jgi:hypothetical protein